MNIYGYTFSVECPNDDAAIEYTLLIQHDEMILVEDIIKACKFPALYQEEIADKLSQLLPGKISLSAEHQGVEVLTMRQGVEVLTTRYALFENLFC